MGMHGRFDLPVADKVSVIGQSFFDREAGGFDLKQLWSLLLRRWRAVGGTAVLSLALATIWLLQVTPLYTATVQVLLDPRKQKTVPGEALVSELALDASTVATEVGLVQTYAVARRVVERLRLVEHAEFGKAPVEIGFLSGLQGFFSALLSLPTDDADLSKGSTQSRRDNTGPAQLRVIDAVQRALTVKRLAATYFLEISFTHTSPETAANLVNAIADSYLDEQLDARYQAAQRAAGWLGERVVTLRQQLEVSEKAVAEHRGKFNLVSPKGGTLSDQQAAEINAQLVAARAQAVEKKAKYEQARGILESGKIESVAEIMQSPAIVSLRQQEAQAAREEADSLTHYGPEHPAIIKIRAQRNDLRRQIRAEVSRLVSTLGTDYEFALKKEQSLDAGLKELTGADHRNDAAVIRLRELERETQANKVLYESLLSRFKEAEQQSSLPTAQSRIVAPALRPAGPSYPSRQRVLMLALAGGLILGFGAAFLLEYLEDGFATIEQVEQTLQLPVLAMVPQLADRERRIQGHLVPIPEYIAHKPLSRFGESVRSVRVSTQLSGADQQPRLMMVTSAIPSEGKTTIALSLAFSAALSHQRVLVMDCDLRHSWTSKYFNLTEGPGLTDLLLGQATAEQAFRRGPIPQMSILPAGTTTLHAPDMLGSETMSALLQVLRPLYDAVIIDAPPLTPVIDSALLSKHVDKVVFVVRWRTTPRDIAARAVAAIDRPRQKIAGVVLNNIQLGRLSSYSPYYSYYHKRYQNYYAQ
jgi:polysaccharide biosynthesis transport protein